ncbi:MAG: nucleoside triphosphate pyrophosphohydrolase [Nitrospirae bacterium]|nr:nucleoside triphosphate pyrophosphohydrolase [Nitrospirota bacterium]MCL5286094.1 nucleoside triphosphate pyrophosphohydrolase [Nitrospirota bacterium]
MTFDPTRYLETLSDTPDTRARPLTESPEDLRGFRRLSRIVDHLRGENGCPFDRKQTLAALVSDLKDEIFELEESVQKEDHDNIAREMGDLFVILFMARRILWERSGQSLGGILDKAAHKMVSRHPHVFETHTPEKSLEAIWETWEEKKRKEPEHRDRTSVLDGIPLTMPALTVAAKQGQKAGRVGFDWPSAEGVIPKVLEEWQEVLEARQEGSERLSEEIGDLLFVLAQFARLSGIRPEEALASANRKFKDRFQSMERAASEKGLPLSSLTAEQWENLWESAKKPSPPLKDPEK